MNFTSYSKLKLMGAPLGELFFKTRLQSNKNLLNSLIPSVAH